MSIRVEKLKTEHLQALLDRRARSFIGRMLTESQAQALESCPHSYSMLNGDHVLACAGVTEYWRNRGEAWAVLDPDCKPHFIRVHGAIKRFLDICPITRVEAAVDVSFGPGVRWVNALGFQYEATLRKFLPDGQDVFFYSRVRED